MGLLVTTAAVISPNLSVHNGVWKVPKATWPGSSLPRTQTIPLPRLLSLPLSPPSPTKFWLPKTARTWPGLEGGGQETSAGTSYLWPQRGFQSLLPFEAAMLRSVAFIPPQPLPDYMVKASTWAIFPWFRNSRGD